MQRATKRSSPLVQRPQSRASRQICPERPCRLGSRAVGSVCVRACGGGGVSVCVSLCVRLSISVGRYWTCADLSLFVLITTRKMKPLSYESRPHESRNATFKHRHTRCAAPMPMPLPRVRVRVVHVCACACVVGVREGVRALSAAERQEWGGLQDALCRSIGSRPRYQAC
jgi:hypothetical protein